MVSPKAKQILRIAIANLAVTFVFLAATELVCRHLGQATFGTRHPLWRKLSPKSVSELRVFAFGGSTVYGEPAPELGFIAQTQYWLRQLYPDRDIRIFNFGWPGVDTSFVQSLFTRRLDDQPDLLIVITGHNEFLASAPQGRLARIRTMLSSHLATMRAVEWVIGRILKFRKVYVMPCQVTRWNRESSSYEDKITSFEKNMELIVERAKQRGVKLIVGTLPSNISDWPPVYKRLAGRDRRYRDTVSQIQELLRGGKYREASDAVTAGFRLYPEDAMLYFLRGQIQSAMGSYVDAHESFVKARDLDPRPVRTSSQLNNIIRRVASGVPGVYAVDFHKIFEEHSKNGLIGFDLIADNVHGTPLGESISAQALIQKMTEIGFLPPSGKIHDQCCPVDAFLADVGYLKPKSPLRLRALLSLGIYAMKTPFLNFDASQKYLLEAREVDKDSWQVWLNLATLSYFNGDKVTGAREFQRALELHHAPFDVNDRESAPYLKEALEYASGHASGCDVPL